MKIIRINVLLILLFTSVTYSEEKFPINIAVEFTDHAASAYIAKEKGWFEEEKIIPTFYNYITGMSMAAALSRGDIQVAYICLFPAINARANANVAIKIVAGTHKYGYALAVNPEKVKQLKDLEKPDIRIAAVQVGGPVDALLLKTIEKFKLDRENILSKVQRMNPPMQIMAIKTGRLEASFGAEHWPSMAEEAGFKILITAQDIWPDMQGSVLIVKEELIKSNIDIVRKIVKITRKATDWIKNNPVESANIMAKHLSITSNNIFPVEAVKTNMSLKIDQDILERSMKRIDYRIDIDKKAVEEAIDFALKEGYIQKMLSVDDILDLRFLNEK